MIPMDSWMKRDISHEVGDFYKCWYNSGIWTRYIFVHVKIYVYEYMHVYIYIHTCIYMLVQQWHLDSVYICTCENIPI